MNEDDRFLDLPDPDTEPEPYFAGLSWQQICAELERLEDEAWYHELMDRQWYQENQ